MMQNVPNRILVGISTSFTMGSTHFHYSGSEEPFQDHSRFVEAIDTTLKLIEEWTDMLEKDADGHTISLTLMKFAPVVEETVQLPQDYLKAESLLNSWKTARLKCNTPSFSSIISYLKSEEAASRRVDKMILFVDGNEWIQTDPSLLPLLRSGPRMKVAVLDNGDLGDKVINSRLNDLAAMCDAMRLDSVQNGVDEMVEIFKSSSLQSREDLADMLADCLPELRERFSLYVGGMKADIKLLSNEDLTLPSPISINQSIEVVGFSHFKDSGVDLTSILAYDSYHYVIPDTPKFPKSDSPDPALLAFLAESLVESSFVAICTFTYGFPFETTDTNDVKPLDLASIYGKVEERQYGLLSAAKTSVDGRNPPTYNLLFSVISEDCKAFCEDLVHFDKEEEENQAKTKPAQITYNPPWCCLTPRDITGFQKKFRLAVAHNNQEKLKELVDDFFRYMSAASLDFKWAAEMADSCKVLTQETEMISLLDKLIVAIRKF